MARDSFKTFIPLSVDNEARSKIIFDFFDLLSAVAAHSKMNGFGGRKISRMAGWWAFEHSDTSNGFEGGYKTWLRQVLVLYPCDGHTLLTGDWAVRPMPRATCSSHISDLSHPNQRLAVSRYCPCRCRNYSKKPNIHPRGRHSCKRRLTGLL